MKYDHLVKFNGEYYPAGTDVPVGDEVKVELTDNVPEGALEPNADGSMNTYDEDGNFAGTVDAEVVAELQEQAGEAVVLDPEAITTADANEESYKKSDITRMSVENLKNLATELGIVVDETATGAKLKEELIAKLGL